MAQSTWRVFVRNAKDKENHYIILGLRVQFQGDSLAVMVSAGALYWIWDFPCSSSCTCSDEHRRHYPDPWEDLKIRSPIYRLVNTLI